MSEAAKSEASDSEAPKSEASDFEAPAVGICLLRACGCKPVPRIQKLIDADITNGKIAKCRYLRRNDPLYQQLLPEAAGELENEFRLPAYFDGNEWNC